MDRSGARQEVLGEQEEGNLGKHSAFSGLGPRGRISASGTSGPCTAESG